ncbi:putative E3 ubiquitin-protein ligase HERC4 [Aphelenchoides besseyi]|nr:putative E3 ubiquitin-protein ligase HERC4 [Aphelenchoides besseyi]KAI6209682.1 putative E3 ubiquitin-protein ligase HERC4 [Aphelenchoides besseyi]
MYGNYLNLSDTVSPKSFKFYTNPMSQQLYVMGNVGDGQFGAIRGEDDKSCAVSPTQWIMKTEDGLVDHIIQICCSERHTLALTSSGQIYSCGANDKGELGRDTPHLIGKVDFRKTVRIVQIATGSAHNLAVADDGRLFAWGSNEYLQCGLNASSTVISLPTRVKDVSQVCQVACGNISSIVLIETNKVLVFGWYINESVKPLEIELLSPVPIRRIEAGSDHYAAISSGGYVLLWGRNDKGQASVLGKSEVRIPVVVAGINSVSQVACGASHTVVLTRDGRIYAFGGNTFGQLGNEDRKDQPSPSLVVDLRNQPVMSIAAGSNHSVVLTPNRLYSFGMNSNGQLGIGTFKNQFKPSPTELTNANALFAGFDQSIIICGEKPHVPHARAARSISYHELSVVMEKGEVIDVKSCLEFIFSSLGCINGSFIANHQNPECSLTNSGLSMDDIMKSFNLIAESRDHEAYAETIMMSLEETKFSEIYDKILTKHRESFVYDELRFFMIIPFFHSMIAPSEKTERQLLAPFINVLAQAVTHFGHILRTWWLILESRHMNRFVQFLMNYVEYRFNKNHTNHAAFVPALNVLKELCHVNRISNRIPYDKFYLNCLSEKVQIHQDYIENFVLMHPDEFARFGQPMPRPGFRWSQYPFLMNAEAKSAILEADSMIRMRHVMHYTSKNDVSKPLRVSFVGEEADDRGGVRKEFFMLLFQELLQPTYGMFTESDESHFIWFSGAIDDTTGYEVVGFLCALAIYNLVLVNLPFPLALYKKILGQALTLEDYSELHPSEGRSLERLLEYEAEDLEDVFCLNFVVSMEIFGHVRQVPLIDDGENVPVTQKNKAEFVEKYIAMKMENGIDGLMKQQIRAFIRGFTRVLNEGVLGLFQPRELQEMVIGNENYDWIEFKKACSFPFLLLIKIPYCEYHARHPVIENFWDVFFELTSEQKKRFLLFLSGTDRIPLRGMKEIPLIIQPMPSELIPVAHTCFNLLDLPKVTDKETMKKRLLLCLDHTQGFTLA